MLVWQLLMNVTCSPVTLSFPHATRSGIDGANSEDHATPKVNVPDIKAPSDPKSLKDMHWTELVSECESHNDINDPKCDTEDGKSSDSTSREFKPSTIKRRQRRSFSFRMKCFPKVTRVCQVLEYNGITKTLCGYIRKRLCYALDK